MMDGAGYGYDPTTREPGEPVTVRYTADLPSAARVNPAYLPPVGRQGTPADPGAPGSCAAWSSTYGLATFVAARAGSADPAGPDGQASPAAIFVQALEAEGAVSATCAGSQFHSYFSILEGDGAAPLSRAPYRPDCGWLWQQYGGTSPAPDPRFAFGAVSSVETADLDSIKQVIAAGGALVYGTKLYTDWPKYAGVPSPYVGNGDIMLTKKGRPVGHCMLIIGYDDVASALLIQNSEGTSWGASGYVSMAYATFRLLAAGQAFFVP